MEKIFALSAFHLILTCCLHNYNCYYLHHDFLIALKRMQGDHFRNTKCVMSVLKSVIFLDIDHGKMMRESWKIMEKSWNLILGKRWEP